MKSMGLYAKGDFVSRLSREELIVLYQAFRIINSLEVWLRFHHVVRRETNQAFEFRNRIELHFLVICLYKESVKEFCRGLADGLLSMDLPGDVSQRVSQYKTWLEGWKHDEYLQVVDRVRNCVRFHFRSSIYDKSVRDGKSEDLLIGYAIGERYMDFLYTEPYTHELAYVAEIVPDAVAAGPDKITWVINRSVEETERFLRLLRDAVRHILKGNTYRKSVDT